MDTPRGVVFDLDNTLLDRTSAMRSWLRAECGIGESSMRAALHVDELGYGDRTAFCAWLARTTGEGTAQSHWAHFRETFGRYVLRDENVLALVARIAARYEVALLTNGTKLSQRRKIAAMGLGEVFEASAMLVSEEIRFWKPDRRAFELASARVGAPPHRIVYVGDHPELDILGARRAGMQTCWVSHGRQFPHDERPDWTVSSLAEIESFL